VTVGETLTEARNQAGLSVDELSERTRIRGTVIRSIERDDYAACGGDLYVRGYVRAIAGAVGIDPQPLIREYDEARPAVQPDGANGAAAAPAGELTAAGPPATFDLPAAARLAGSDTTRFDLPRVSDDPVATSFDLPALASLPRLPPLPAAAPLPAPPVAPSPVAPSPGQADTRFDLPVITDDLMAAGYDLPPSAEPDAPGAAAAGSATSVLPAVSAEPGAAAPAGGGPEQPHGSRRHRAFLGVAVVAIVLVAAGILGIRLLVTGSPTRNTAATSAATPAASAAAQASASAQASAAARASAAAKASQATATKAPARPAAQRVTTLPVASAAAFGPGGLADGDNPGGASNAIARSAATPWSTQWYVSPQFGMLKHGTGLLLNLGRTVTVTSVRLDLSQYQGAALQLRTGDGTAPQDLRVAATASNASGAVRLTLRHPVTARYLLIWITKLPPDGAGHYAETVSGVVVTGHR
jgi:cytoskeletal protein RodZ